MSVTAPPEFRLIANSAPVAMWLTGLDRRRRFVNRVYQDFLALDYEAARDLDWREIIHPDDYARIVRESLDGEATLQRFALEGRFRNGAGEYRWLRSISQPVFDDAGEHVGFAGVAVDLTETRLAQQQAERRQQQLSGYINQSMAGFAEVDLTGRFTLVNDRFCEITGYSREELLEVTMQSITHPDELPRNQVMFTAAVANGTPYQHEKRYIRKDGSHVWVNNSVTVVRLPGQEASGVLAVSIDITSRKEAEQHLVEAEETLRLATEGAGIGTWVWDIETNTGTLSPQAQAMYGAHSGVIMTMEERMALIHPADRERLWNAVATALREGDEFAYEYRILHSGGVRWVASRGRVVRDADGKAIRNVGTVQDITDRKLAQEKLEALNGRLAEAIAERTRERDGMWRLSRDLLIVMDNHLRIVRASPVVEELTGWSPTEIEGRHLRRFIHPHDWERVLRAMRAVRHGTVNDLEARIVHRDGTIREFSWNAAPEGSLAYASGRDITAEKARVTELLAAQEALRQSQKLEAIGQLTGGVAHDFNNLLSPIIGSLDLLRRRKLGGEREQVLIEGALQSADRARVLVQRLLTFARRQPLQLKVVDLARLVEDMRGLLHSTLGPGIRLVIETAPGRNMVRADGNQLEMAIINLAVNARDAMPHGGQLRLALSRDLFGDVLLAVSDTGSGMDEATLARATEPFFSSKGVGKGTGLGLSMVDGLTAQLGGSMHIESALGQGTTVTLRLPATQGEADTPEAAAEGEQLSCKGRILLVDDEPLVRTSTAAVLGDFGFEVTAVDGAEAALDLLVPGAFDCLVSDHLMPGMTGLELARKCAGMDGAPPTLIVSGYADLESLGGDQPYLAKPFAPTDLARAIMKLVDG